MRIGLFLGLFFARIFNIKRSINKAEFDLVEEEREMLQIYFDELQEGCRKKCEENKALRVQCDDLKKQRNVL